jgi:hypothetical protein
MILPAGARVSVLWTDGRRYSGITLGARDGWYAVRFDGNVEPTWAPAANVTLDGGLPEGGMAAAAAAGVAVYDEGAEVMAQRAGRGRESCMIIEYVAERGLYNVIWNGDNEADFIPPSAIEASSHHGVYGQAAQEELNNQTLPVGTHVVARRHDGRTCGGTITANLGDRFLCRWDGERARQYLTKADVMQTGGAAPAAPARPGELGIFVQPHHPPTHERKDWYPDGDTVWAEDTNDHWWYEATVLGREWVTQPGVAGGSSRYELEWADGLGRTHCFDTHLRVRRAGIF